MLSCITKDQTSLYAPSCETKLTRQMSNNKLLLCPNCLKRVIFCSGPKMGSYFRHFDDEACVVSYSEPETKKHRMGKEVLYKWLKNTFKTSIVETEKRILETNQIADILVTHTKGKVKGDRWAFEFQHSNLSARDWEERHNLYQKANITDFWILDAEVFLKHSKSKDSYIQKSRLQKEPQEAIFSSTGFCYFLNLNTLVLTIDYKFRYEDIKVERPNGGYFPKKEYKFHKNSEQSCHLHKVCFEYNEEFNFLAMCYENIGAEFYEEFEWKIQKLRGEKQKKWEEELVNRGKQKVQYAHKEYGEAFSDYMIKFMRENKEAVQNDAFNLSEKDFIDTYKSYVLRLQKYDEERMGWKESSDDTSRVLYRMSNRDEDRDEMRNIKFLNKNKSTLKEHYLEKYADKIELVNYVLQEYGNTFEKLSALQPIRRDRFLYSISKEACSLTPPKSNPTKYDFAYAYRNIGSKEKVDEILKFVREETNLLK
ncbi:competence protein CoiA [Bacillus cereus]|uniref:competence protein CoiA n=1 Tax=Bacillus cereus TaxID=1396 RepID=UPI000B4B00DA|nr:competence protein CoiA family protein [Bacillus cereus]